jgi:hypothetical protein
MIQQCIGAYCDSEPREGDHLRLDMAENQEAGLNSETMATPIVLKTIKKEVRALMKQKLSKISAESVDAQSRPAPQYYFESILLKSL